jgi:hypothetical protein
MNSCGGPGSVEADATSAAIIGDRLPVDPAGLKPIMKSPRFRRGL